MSEPTFKAIESCEGCRFFWPGRDQCRRNAPVPGRGDFERAKWPIVFLSDWCGEYKPVPGEKAEAE